jgi:hypothetical protein
MRRRREGLIQQAMGRGIRRGFLLTLHHFAALQTDHHHIAGRHCAYPFAPRHHLGAGRASYSGDRHHPRRLFVFAVDLRIGHQPGAGHRTIEIVGVGGAGRRNSLPGLRQPSASARSTRRRCPACWCIPTARSRGVKTPKTRCIAYADSVYPAASAAYPAAAAPAGGRRCPYRRSLPVSKPSASARSTRRRCPACWCIPTARSRGVKTPKTVFIQQRLLHIRQLRRQLAAEDAHIGDLFQHDGVMH